MISFRYFTSLCLSLLLLTFVSGCKDKKDDKQNDADFDRGTMLTNLGNNIIIPNYQDFSSKADQLSTAVETFNNNPDENNLIAVQNAFKAAYLSYAKICMLEFGPAEQQALRSTINIFPTDTVKINSNISAGGYNLDAISNAIATGFPAMDFLLFGTGKTNAEIVYRYTADANAAQRKTYLAEVAAQIKTKANSIYNAWIPGGGNYINTFVNATGTDIGSSVGLLVNQMNFELDNLKNARIGIPLGKQSLGTIYPEKTEAFYSGISVDLGLAQLKASQELFLGKSGSSNGSGFDDYLNYVGAVYNGSSLSDAINNQFNTAITTLDNVPDPLSGSIVNNSTQVNSAYIEIQKLLVLYKTDLPSSLGVLITYNDNDGD